jgi:uncharacterized protein (TIGR02453 family)
MAFRGWPAEAVEFYEGLEADNSKAYWQDHKAVYDKLVRGPMDELLTELGPEFGEGKVFRPYRDVRFSADKAPYKTAMGATLAHGGYVQFSARGLGVGCGYYTMAPDQLERYRLAVGADRTGTDVARLATAATKAGLEVTAHETLKTAPKGYPKDHPRIDLLRQKGLITWKEWAVGSWLGTAKAKQRVAETLRSSVPLMNWLDANVGPSTVAGPDRR